MTDKQIIIDKSDISECPISPKCIEFGDCKIKIILEQLKAKEQECETLASQLDFEVQKKECLEQECEQLRGELYITEESLKDYKAHYDRQCEQLDQLKAENEELKKIIKRLDVPKHEVIDMDIALENEKLKQTLTEIKEFVENEMTQNGDTYIILQKINEVR